MGWTMQIIEEAREMMYDFIQSGIREDVPSLHQVLSPPDVWGTRNRSQTPMLTQYEALYETNFTRMQHEDCQYDSHDHIRRQGRSNEDKVNKTTTETVMMNKMPSKTPNELGTDGQEIKTALAMEGAPGHN